AARRALYGDRAAQFPLARTEAQRGYDAMIAMGLKAAGTNASTDREPLVVIRCTEQDLADALALLLSAKMPEPDDRSLRKRLCETSSGAQVDLIDLALAALIGKVQRIVTARDGHTIELGRKRRLFTGAVRAAVLLAGDRCCWPGCEQRTGRMHVDHIREWARHFGPTASWNGSPMCQGHNQAKHEGQFTVKRDEHGWHLYRADGTEVARREPH
ncbi:MAG: hypothetical protein JWN39_2962, partial [Ilumatobacteraceae bacterium]|nr:hypothetical protein [Ilumatobacteraceae bacterium]